MHTFSQLEPILASFKRHRLTVILLCLQIAGTFAILCNAGQMAYLRLQPMQQASGLAEEQLLVVNSTRLDPAAERPARQRGDLAALGQLAGVRSVIAVDALPFNGSNWTNGIATAPQGSPGRRIASPSAFNGTPGELATLGLHLLAGRDFLPDEYVPEDSAHGWDGINHVGTTIVSAALARRLFPSGQALGQSIDAGGDHGIRIVGIVERLLRPARASQSEDQDSMLFPMLPDTAHLSYVMHLQPQANRNRLMAAIRTTLLAQPGRKIIDQPTPFPAMRTKFFRHDREMIGLLLAAIAGLMLVTAIGVAGLANFWVQQRRTSIGVRRALGATRLGIRGYFQLENAVIVCLAAIPGIALSYALNQWLMEYGELPRLPLSSLPAAGLGLLLLCQLAILSPSQRAAAISPMAAIRS